MDGFDGFVGMLAAVIVLSAFYFIPVFVAAHRGCRSVNRIAVVNLLLGWTVLGWIGALAWAVSGETKVKEQNEN